MMLSALLMLGRFLGALRVALRDQEFGRILVAAGTLVLVGTIAYTLGEDWSPVDGFYVAVATLTTSSVLDPELTVTEPWLKIFTSLYVLIGIGILVEVARRLGMGFIVFRQEEVARKAEEKARKAAGSKSGGEA
jgi:hypothetical protein